MSARPNPLKVTSAVCGRGSYARNIEVGGGDCKDNLINIKIEAINIKKERKDKIKGTIFDFIMI
ncbi:MAG: hypothetical protein V1662_03490 [Candidatus Omnitrophota bacterium]